MIDTRFYRKKIQSISIKEIAAIFPLISSGTGVFTELLPIDEAGADHITFLTNPKYINQTDGSLAGAYITSANYCDRIPDRAETIVAENPYFLYAKLLEQFYELIPENYANSGGVVHPTAQIAPSVYIGENAEIGANTRIMPHSFIGRGCKIGSGCYIGSGVSILCADIADRTYIHPNVAIGQDGFGFAYEKGFHYKLPQLGRVIIGEDVEIGACTTIDRGSSKDTIIGNNCKIDNLVQIAHNVILGRGVIVVSQVGIAGSTQISDYVVIGGQAGIAGHLNIGAGAKIAACSGVMKDVAAGAVIGGSPSMPIKEWHRSTIALKKLSSQHHP